MTEIISTWIRGIVAVAIICGAAINLSPDTKSKSVLKFATGLLMIIAIISPLISKALPDLKLGLSEYRKKAEEISENAKEEMDLMNRTYISEQLVEYIFGIAQEEDFPLENVKVEMAWSDEGFFYPTGLDLSCKAGSHGKSAMERLLETELGIEKESVTWEEIYD